MGYKFSFHVLASPNASFFHPYFPKFIIYFYPRRYDERSSKYRPFELSDVSLNLCSLSYSLAESFCVDILDPEVVLGQYLKHMTCQVEAE